MGSPRTLGMERECARERVRHWRSWAPWPRAAATVRTSKPTWPRSNAFDTDMTPKRDGVAPLVSKGKYLHIYERQNDGSWLMIRDMFSDNGGSP